jgi:hypothetical protein
MLKVCLIRPPHHGDPLLIELYKFVVLFSVKKSFFTEKLNTIIIIISLMEFVNGNFQIAKQKKNPFHFHENATTTTTTEMAQ